MKNKFFTLDVCDSALASKRNHCTQLCSILYHQYMNEANGDIIYLGWINYVYDLKSSVYETIPEIHGEVATKDYLNRSTRYQSIREKIIVDYR